MQTFKFWIDRGETKSEEDFLTPDSEIVADNSHRAAELCAEEMDRGMGDTMRVFCLCPDGEWLEFQMEFGKWHVYAVTSRTESDVMNEFEV